MIRCVVCGHGLREMVHFEPDYDNEPYYFVDVCMECVKKINKRLKEDEDDRKKEV